MCYSPFPASAEKLTAGIVTGGGSWARGLIFRERATRGEERSSADD
jgi:uridylate kinase